MTLKPIKPRATPNATAPAVATASASEGLGAVFDSLVLFEELPGGSMPTFRAHQTEGRGKADVVVRPMPPGLAQNPEVLERVKASFAAVTALRHPHIVPFLGLHRIGSARYDVPALEKKLEVTKGDYLAVTEFASGMTLSAWRRSYDARVVPFADAARVIAQVCTALDYANKQGVLHLDLKPENVVVEKRKKAFFARVMDFCPMPEHACENASPDSPYVAPELVKGKRPTSEADQYAAAVLFLELVTGDGKIASAERLPAAAKTVVVRAMSDNPDVRYASCMAFARALCAAIPGAADKKVSIPRLLGLLLLALLPCGCAGWWFLSSAVPAATPIDDSAAKEAVSAKARAEKEKAAREAVEKAKKEADEAARAAAAKAAAERDAAAAQAREVARRKATDETCAKFRAGQWADALALSKDADKDAPELAYWLGRLYAEGRAGAVDAPAAVRYLQSSAQQAYLPAQQELARICEKGEILPKDLAASLYWYERAGEQGDTNALYRAALHYANGQGTASNAVKAVELCRKAAGKGLPVANLTLGSWLARGFGTAADLKGAADCYRLAAEAGLADAQMAYADCLQDGRGVAANVAKALIWRMRAAEHGNRQAQRQYAEALEQGVGTEVDLPRALELYNRAANAGDAIAQRRLGCLTRNAEAAAEWFQKAARQGDALAQTLLAKCLLEGRGVKRNATLGVEWLRKAAVQGDAEALYLLARCTFEGRGARENADQAVKLLRLAAEKGFASAEFQLSSCFAEGRGVVTNAVEAFAWCRRAAEQGLEKAQFELGRRYALGDGVERNPAEAVKWYRKAADQNLAGAQLALGECADGGRGTPASPEEAASWYRKAAEQGLPEAQVRYGDCCLYGRGVPRNPSEAVDWFQRAARQGSPAGQRALGLCHDNGDGVPENAEKAVACYQAAVQGGDVFAKALLSQCYFLGTGVKKNPFESWRLAREAAEAGNAFGQYMAGLCSETGTGAVRSRLAAKAWYEKAVAQGLECARERLAALRFK